MTPRRSLTIQRNCWLIISAIFIMSNVLMFSHYDAVKAIITLIVGILWAISTGMYYHAQELQKHSDQS